MILVLMVCLCIGGVLFYVRFLVALCKEYRECGIWYLVRLHTVVSETERETALPGEESFPRAA